MKAEILLAGCARGRQGHLQQGGLHGRLLTRELLPWRKASCLVSQGCGERHRSLSCSAGGSRSFLPLRKLMP